MNDEQHQPKNGHDSDHIPPKMGESGQTALEKRQAGDLTDTDYSGITFQHQLNRRPQMNDDQHQPKNGHDSDHNPTNMGDSGQTASEKRQGGDLTDTDYSGITFQHQLNRRPQMNDDQHQPKNGNDSDHNPTKDSGQTALEKRQEMLAHHVRLVTRKLSHALFIFGPTPGIGKTRTVLRTLEQENVTPVLLNSHITPLALYEALYNHREDAVLFLDDVDSMFSSMAHLGLLRSALWGSPRTVTYSSSALPNHLPPRFDFESSMIICVNVVPSKQNAAFSAVVSRCDQFEMHATNEEIIDLMRSQSEDGFNGITTDDCREVIDFIEERSSEGSKQLSLRLLAPALRKFRYAREMNVDWRALVETQLSNLGEKTQVVKRSDTKNRDLQAMKEAISSFPDSPQEQLASWSEATGKSRASYFRCLQRYRDMGEA